MADPDRTPATNHVGFRALRAKLNTVVAGVEKVPAHPEAKEQIMSAWSLEALDALGEVLTDTKQAISGLPEPAKTSWAVAVNALVKGHLHREVGPVKLLPVECQLHDLTPCEEADLYDSLADELADLLELFATDVLTPTTANLPGTPEGDRAYIARRLGRTEIDTYVSKRRNEDGRDLPWVVRRPGLPWMVDLEAFERWVRNRPEEMLTEKRKPGRPPKVRI